MGEEAKTSMSSQSTPEGADCGVPNACAREVPRWLVALDNVPTIGLFVLGTLIILQFWWLPALLFAVYCGLSIILFWSCICPFCHHFKTKACPCGYGAVAPRFFKSKLGQKDFRRVFRYNIAIMFPCWVAPLVVGIYLLLTSGFILLPVLLLVAFCIDGFLLIPAISVLVGCKDCQIKDQCPWMSREKTQNTAGKDN